MKRSSVKGSSSGCQWWDVKVEESITPQCGKPATHKLPGYLLNGDMLICTDHAEQYRIRHPHNTIQLHFLVGTKQTTR
jgi:hypothetical protein